MSEKLKKLMTLCRKGCFDISVNPHHDPEPKYRTFIKEQIETVIEALRLWDNSLTSEDIIPSPVRRKMIETDTFIRISVGLSSSKDTDDFSIYHYDIEEALNLMLELIRKLPDDSLDNTCKVRYEGL